MAVKTIRVVLLALLCALLLPVPGCTSRTLTITSNPPGAEVSVNRRPIGVTPLRVGFTHYGTYRVELRKVRFETLVKEEDIQPRWYGYEPISAVADNAIPARINDDIYLHYVLKAEGEPSERTALLERAEQAKNGIALNANRETVTVAYTIPEKTPEQAAKAAAANAQNPASGTPGESAKVVVDPKNFQIKTIQAETPEGLRIAKDLNIKPVVPEKKPDAIKPANPEPKRDGPPSTRIPPKQEDLIFDKPNAPKAYAPKPDKPDTSIEVPAGAAPKPATIQADTK